ARLREGIGVPGDSDRARVPHRRDDTWRQSRRSHHHVPRWHRECVDARAALEALRGRGQGRARLLVRGDCALYGSDGRVRCCASRAGDVADVETAKGRGAAAMTYGFDQHRTIKFTTSYPRTIPINYLSICPNRFEFASKSANLRGFSAGDATLHNS